MNSVMVCEKRGLFPFLFLPLFFVMAVFLFAQNEALAAAPAYRASGTFTSGAAVITPPYPAGMLANDICLLAVESENEAISLTTANGFVEVPIWSPQSAGTAATDPASRLALFWKRAVGGDAAPVVADSGNHTTGQIHCFSGVITSGNPWDTGAGGNDGAVNDTTGTIPGSTTTVIDTLVVLITSTSFNGTSNVNCSNASWINAGLTSLTERADNTNTQGVGGGHCMATGVKATAGAYAATTVTLANTSFKGAISLALKPGMATVVSVNCPVSCAATSAATVSWTVVFDQSVTGVDATAFALVASGLSGAYITTVTGSGTTWTVTANTGIGAGTLGLNQTGPGLVVPTLSGTFTGQVYTISATPALAEYRMDESDWTAAAGQVVDSSGNGNHAQAFNSANTVNATPAISGSPGTCGYGVFDNGTTITQGYVQTPLPNLTTDFTVTAWIRTTNNTVGAQRILIDDQGTAPATGYGFSLGEAGTGKLRFFSRGITPVILDSTYVIANNTWYFVAAVADVTNKKRTIYVFNAAGTFLNSITEAAWTAGAWGTDGGPVSIGAETNASAETPAANHFKGNIDEVRVFQKVLNQAALAAIATQSHACPGVGPDHYELSLPTASIACMASTATVTACADTSSPCTNNYTAASGTTATLATSAGALGATTVTFNASGVASTTLSYPAAADGAAASVTLSGEQTAATNLRKCCPDGINCVVGNSCSSTFNTAGFIFASSIGGMEAIIPTQVAGTSSSTYYLRAIKSNTKATTATQACQAALTGTSAVNFAYECNNPTSCYTANLMSVNGGIATTIARNNNGSVVSYLPVNMTFDANGNAPFTFNYSDAGQVTLYASKTAGGSLMSTLAGSSNAFVVKPGGFVLSSIQQTAAPNLVNPAAADATGNKFVMAGEPFSITVTATTSGGATAPNYGKETTPESVKLTSALVAGLGMTNNPAVGGTFGAFTNGVATGTAFTWNEVGIIRLTPSVGDGDYLGVGDVSGTQTGNIGRFYAAKFALSGGVIANRTDIAACPAPAGCGTFTYMGEQMSAVFNLTAKAVDGATTLQNYNWSATPANQFAKLNPLAAVTAGTGGSLVMGAVDSAATRTPFPPCGVLPAHPCLTPEQATAGTFVSGMAGITVPFTLYRDNAIPSGPYAALDIAIAPQDSDGVIMAAYNRDTVNVVAGANNHTLVGQTIARYGRLKLSNAYGSELLPLTLTATAQYYTAAGNWMTNSDSSTQLVLPASYSVGAGTTTVTLSPTTGILSSGTLNINLGAPSVTGKVTVTPTFTPPSASSYLPLTSGQATFGVYRGRNEFIYMRENY